MVRNNFIFLKNIESRYIRDFFLDYFENNFIFFKKFKKNLSINLKFVNLKKVNCNKQCVNILYF